MSHPFSPTSIRKDPLHPPNLFYHGSSMKGTFKPGDKLIIEKVPFNQIKKGDIIIFRRTCEDQSDFIVHRVAGISPKGLITRGDNCFDRDREQVNEENLIGRVIRHDRRKKSRRIWNGGAGQMRAAVLHARLHPFRWLKYLLRKPYTMLKKTGIIAKMWHPEIELIQFETPDGPLVKYLHKGMTVAESCRSASRWCIKRPYDFIMNHKTFQ